jgi:hypothetical protein
MFSRFQTVRSKLLARQAALEEAARQHRPAAVEAQDRLHLRAEPHLLEEPRLLALVALTLVLNVHLLPVVTPSAQARNVQTSPQHLEARRLTAETHLTRLATAPAIRAPVLSARSLAAVPAVAPLALNSPLVELKLFRSALFPRFAWLLSLPLLLSHSDQSNINISGHSAKVRHVSPHNHDQY